MADKKSFETIMLGISSGLTGDYDKDLEYLREESDKYKDHEFGKEILRAIGRMMYEMLPDDRKKDLDEALGRDMKGIDATLEEVRFNIYKKDFDKALRLIEDTVKEQETTPMFEDDSVSEYHNFREPMEEILYDELEHPEKTLRNATINYAEMYMLYGCILVELKRLDEAEIALKKAVKWNPVAANIAFEHAETMKMRGRIEDFLDCSKKIFKYAFRPADLARCYRNLSYYFVEKKKYETAVCCLLFSTQFEKHDLVQSELYYISQVSGKMYNPTEEELNKCFEDNEIPSGPNVEILKIAYGYGRHFYESGNMDAAAYFLSIFASFINDEEANKMLEDAKTKVEQQEG